MSEPFHVRRDGPIHGWFGLSYSNYFVLPRALLQSLPVELQMRLVAVLEEVEAVVSDVPQAEAYRVFAVAGGKFAEDPVPHYRRAPDLLPRGAK